MSLITVVTIVRNDQRGLEKTRESIASQSFRDFDWLVIDGASTDGTAQYALSLDEPHVTAVSERDAGIFDAMNKGLDRARGDFVVFLNAGDIFAAPDSLASVAEKLRTGTVDFLYGDSYEAFAGERLVYKVARGHQGVNYGMFGCHQAMYYRRALIADQRYDQQLKVAGDYGFTAQFLGKKPCIERLHVALCIFDLTGVSMSNRQRGRQENWRVQRDYLGLSVAHRMANRSAYLVTAFLATRLPFLYKILRFRKQDGN